ncbi:MAG TPA: ABC transporter substrate-binding protein [Myxococcota bacterium]|nr:ABC transporter substrate-binding protein [Myxococcota bacterium]
MGCLALALLCGCGAEPRRVVSLSPSTTRVAEALGLADRLESLDPNTPKAIERAFTSGANLAIAGPDFRDLGAAFAARGIQVRRFTPESTEDVLSAYTEIASVLGKPKAAAALIQRVNDEIASGRSAQPTRVALVVSRAPLSVVGGDAFLSKLLGWAGVENAFGDRKGVVVTLTPAALQAGNAARVIDVARPVLGDAWVDPVGTARALQNVVSAD